MLHYCFCKKKNLICCYCYWILTLNFGHYCPNFTFFFLFRQDIVKMAVLLPSSDLVLLLLLYVSIQSIVRIVHALFALFPSSPSSYIFPFYFIFILFFSFTAYPFGLYYCSAVSHTHSSSLEDPFSSMGCPLLSFPSPSFHPSLTPLFFAPPHLGTLRILLFHCCFVIILPPFYTFHSIHFSFLCLCFLFSPPLLLLTLLSSSLFRQVFLYSTLFPFLLTHTGPFRHAYAVAA